METSSRRRAAPEGEPFPLLDLPDLALYSVLHQLEKKDRVALARCSWRCATRVLSLPRSTLHLYRPVASPQRLFDTLRSLTGEYPDCARGTVCVGGVGVSIGYAKHLQEAYEQHGGDAMAMLEQFVAAGLHSAIRQLDINCRDVPTCLSSLPELERLTIAGEDHYPVPYLAEGGLAKLRYLQVQLMVGALPEGLESLETLYLVNCPALNEEGAWLPESSSRKLKKLGVLDMPMPRIPAHCPALEEIEYSWKIEYSWSFNERDLRVPPSLSGQIRKLSLHGSQQNVPVVPPGLSALEVLLMKDDLGIPCINDILELPALPASSVANLRVLHLIGTLCRGVPENLSRLEELTFTHRREASVQLSHSWLPASSRRSIRKLNVTFSRVSAIPGGLDCVEELDVRLCTKLRSDDWLPDDAARRIRKLTMDNTMMEQIPDTLTQLQELYANGCRNLAGPLSFPDAVTQNLRVLTIKGAGFNRLPAGLSSLEVLDISDSHLDPDWYPASASKSLRVLRARNVDTVEDGDAVRLPDGLSQLQLLDVVGSKLAGDWLPEGSRGALTDLAMCCTRVEGVPGGCARLQRVDVRGCGFVASGSAWMPASSTGRLRVIYVGSEEVPRVDVPAHVAINTAPDAPDFTPCLERKTFWDI
ncbi:unnamed protein product [Pedinophyceae sp. YPF-701]|nr:unnamed protein product [Pedinophyceae sp. YPF-701]